MNRTGIGLVLGNAVVWAAVLVGAAVALAGTGCYAQVSTVLGGGAATSVLLVGGGVRRLTS